MIDRHHALIVGRDDLRMIPNTYRPGMGWRDLTVAERDAAMRMTHVMAYPEPRTRWTDWLGLAAVAAFEAACWLGVAWLVWKVVRG